jgi:hypothetical protein
VKGERFSIALLAFLLASNAARMAGKDPIRTEQMQFSIEEEMEKPAAIPPDVLAILSADEYVSFPTGKSRSAAENSSRVLVSRLQNPYDRQPSSNRLDCEG